MTDLSPPSIEQHTVTVADILRELHAPRDHIDLQRVLQGVQSFLASKPEKNQVTLVLSEIKTALEAQHKRDEVLPPLKPCASSASLTSPPPL